MSNIAGNLEQIRRNMAQAAEKSGRSAGEVALVAVTKTRSCDEILPLQDLGVDIVGENRAQELLSKTDCLSGRFNIHFIGHLQTNKVKQVVPHVSMIQSVDSLRLAQAIDRECERAGRVMDILVEVNTSDEPAKQGVTPEGALDLIGQAAALAHVRVQGLMTMAMFTDDQNAVRACFERLAEIKRAGEKAGTPLPHLSMGMTNDYITAIEAGATIVRIGSALFAEGDN